MQWNLIKLRKERKCTQEDLANLLNISTEGYRLKELGKHQFKNDEMFIIADFLTKILEIFFYPQSTRNANKHLKGDITHARTRKVNKSNTSSNEASKPFRTN